MNDNDPNCDKATEAAPDAPTSPETPEAEPNPAPSHPAVPPGVLGAGERVQKYVVVDGKFNANAMPELDGVPIDVVLGPDTPTVQRMAHDLERRRTELPHTPDGNINIWAIAHRMHVAMLALSQINPEAEPSVTQYLVNIIEESYTDLGIATTCCATHLSMALVDAHKMLLHARKRAIGQAVVAYEQTAPARPAEGSGGGGAADSGGGGDVPLNENEAPLGNGFSTPFAPHEFMLDVGAKA